MSTNTAFEKECDERIRQNGNNPAFVEASRNWSEMAMDAKYMYNFKSLGRPIIQFPQDMVATQELIWEARPDLIIETGIAHGGSLIQSAMMLAMLDICDAIEAGSEHLATVSKRKVLGVDIEIREHNRIAIENHPMAGRIQMLEGSSIDPSIVSQVKEVASEYERVLVMLDSMHTHDHVLGELEAYANLASVGSYCVVFDTFVEDISNDMFPDRPWSVGDNPKTAVHEWLKSNDNFEIDKHWDNKIMISVAPDGFLRRVS